MSKLIITAIILSCVIMDCTCVKKTVIAPIPIIEYVEEVIVEEEIVLPEPEPEVVPEPVVIVDLTIYFALNSYVLSSEALLILDAIGTSTYKITGNTCTAGTDIYNYALGLRRAKAVHDHLNLDDRSICVSNGEGICYDKRKQDCRNVRITSYDND